MRRRIALVPAGLFTALLLSAALPATASAQAPAGGEVPVSAESDELPRIAWAANRYVVVWAHEGFEENLDVIFKREFAADGTPLGDAQAVSGPNDGARDRPDVAAAPDGSYAIVWQDDVIETSPGDPDSTEDVMMRRYDAQGVAGPIEQVSFAPGEVLTEYQELDPAVAMTPTGFPVVAWWEDSLSGGRTVVRNLAPEGAPNADLPLATTEFSGVDLVTQPEGRFVLLYPDATGAWDMRRFAATGTPLTAAIDFAGSSVLFPRMAADSTGALVVATDEVLSLGQQALWRRFSPELTGLGTAFSAPADAAVGSVSAGMAPDGRFVVAYDREIPPGDSDIAVRSFGSDGTPLTAELIATVGTELDQFDPDVAATPDGGFAVVWLDPRPGAELRARFYSATGSGSTPPSGGQPPAPAPQPVKKKCPKGKKLKKVKGKRKCVKTKKKGRR
jgi:large repetitive protein